MLNQYLIEKLAQEQKIAPLNIIREYLETEVLFYLSQTKLSERLIFYGGTALRLAYKSFRFSEDLDFLFKKVSPRDKQELTKALRAVVQANDNVKLEEVVDKRQTLFGLLHIKNNLLKHPIRLKIEISKKANGVKAENLLLISPTSNKEVIFQTATLTALHQLKKKAITSRNLPRDWFDYWYLSQKLNISKPEISKKFPFSSQEFGRELKRWLPADKWKIIKTVINFYL